MNPDDIQDGLIDACKAVAQARGLTPVLPGVKYEEVPRPGIVFDYVPTDRPNVTLKGDVLREIGTFSAAITVTIGASTTSAAHGHATAIAAALQAAGFAGPKITITGGLIHLSKPVDIRPGYPDGAAWRVPVVARYEANAT